MRTYLICGLVSLMAFSPTVRAGERETKVVAFEVTVHPGRMPGQNWRSSPNVKVENLPPGVCALYFEVEGAPDEVREQLKFSVAEDIPGDRDIVHCWDVQHGQYRQWAGKLEGNLYVGNVWHARRHFLVRCFYVVRTR